MWKVRKDREVGTWTVVRKGEVAVVSGLSGAMKYISEQTEIDIAEGREYNEDTGQYEGRGNETFKYDSLEEMRGER